MLIGSYELDSSFQLFQFRDFHPPEPVFLNSETVKNSKTDKMESIKHKMDTMVKEKDAAIEKAMGFEAETADLNKAASKFEKEVDEIQRKIAKDRN